MNPAKKRYESDSMKIWKKKKVKKIGTRFVLMIFWIDGLEFGEIEILKKKKVFMLILCNWKKKIKNPIYQIKLPQKL